MQAGRRYTFWQTLIWQKKMLFVFMLFDAAVVLFYFLTKWDVIIVPWQPISLIGIAVAFYLGFKNNSSYERLWEARKIWGGIVNTSRSLTVMARDFITNEHAVQPVSDEELREMHKNLVHRHVAWLYALTFQLRNLKDWEHNSKDDADFRRYLGLEGGEERYELIKPYLSESEYSYVMSKGNRASHLVSLQSKYLNKLKMEGFIEDFRHMELQGMITELYTLQGKSERIKNFPFPRQYASANYFFVWIFITLLPFSMLSIFARMTEPHMLWMAIPASILVSWVFWVMESIGEYSENPFEGLYNDVPITSISRGIEIDIRQMIEETDLPEPYKPTGGHKILY